MTDADLLQAFEACTLPFAQWTHRAHVKVGYLYLRQYPFDEAMRRVRASIKAYNAAHNTPESPVRGYNETTTRAFLQLIAATISACDKTHPVTTADEFCDKHPQLMTPNVLRLFYSPHHRMHPLAKLRFIEPDLAPLPRIIPALEPADWTTIRPATLADCNAIAHVHVQSWRSTYKGIIPGDHLAGLDEVQQAQRREKYIATPGTFHFVAEAVNAGIIGFINGGPERSRDPHYDAEIYAVYLLANHQRRGLGAALVCAMASQLLEKGFSRLLIWVLTQNPSRSFYEKIGGKYLRTQPITIGGITLQEAAYGWDDLQTLTRVR
jgi:GNAT superfamily N-acetyltransferase